MSGSVSIRHFILGLLAQQPMSGYDVKRFLKSLSWLIDVPSFGSLYPALHGLREEGLVTMEVASSEGRPPRKIYSITDGGREVLREWMGQPVSPNASMRPFVMRLLLAGHLSPSSLRAHLERRRAKVAAHRAALEEAVGTMDEMDPGEGLALDYGLALAGAELAWLDRALDWLPHMQFPIEAAAGVQGGAASRT